MAVRLLMGKRKKTRNGYRMQDYGDGEAAGYLHDTDEDETSVSGSPSKEVFAEEDLQEDDDGAAGNGVSKPLMHPRDRTRVKATAPDCRCGALCRPVLYFLLMVAILGGLVSVLLYVLHKRKDAMEHQGQSPAGPAHPGGVASPGPGASLSGAEEKLVGCDAVSVEDVWVVGVPKVITESAFRMVDVNADGVLDVIMGFGTGADGHGAGDADLLCRMYFNKTAPCFGGLMALEGLTGRELWRHYSVHELFALNCNVDLDQDGVLDCVAGGRAAAFEAVSGREGRLLWTFQDGEVKKRFSNVYTPQFVPDLDGDHSPDIVVTHGGDPIAEPHSKTREAGRLLVVSGRTGQVLRWKVVPGAGETYYSPQVYSRGDGDTVVLFGTGGETHAGSLWVISLEHVIQGRIDKALSIYSDDQKGVMTPPVLADLTGDGVVDIIINPFNSSVLAIDGRTYQLLWNTTFPGSESYSTPAAGFYNDDDIPDILVKASFGPGYPVYYHAEAVVLDGRNGQPIVHPATRFSVATQSSPLSVSLEGRGHDLFLFWLADCKGHEGEGGVFTYVNGTNVHEMSRSDICELRFQSPLFTEFRAFSRNIPLPGVAFYKSEERNEREHADWVNTTALAITYLRSHPDVAAEVGYGVPQEPPPDGEDYLPGGAPSGGAHSPTAKKGPGQRGDYPSRYSQRRPFDQDPQLRNRQYKDYSPFSGGPYEDKDPYYPRRGEEEARGRGGGGQGRGRYRYPYNNFDRKQGYPADLPGDGYGSRNGGYSNDDDGNYPPYGNYYQKRDFDRPRGDGGGGGGGGDSDGGGGARVGEGGRPRSKEPRGRPQTQHSPRGDGRGNPARLSDREPPKAAADPASVARARPRNLSAEKSSSAVDDVDSGRPGTLQSRARGRKPAHSNPGATQGGGKGVVAGGQTTEVGGEGVKSGRGGGWVSTSRQDAGHGGVAKPAGSSHPRGPVFMRRRRRGGVGGRLERGTGAKDRERRGVDDRRGDSAGEDEGWVGLSERVRERRGVKGRDRRHVGQGAGGRDRRHVGPHDGDGLQRLLSTGSLAPSSLPPGHPDEGRTVDVVFATYWFFPAKARALLPQDQECLQAAMDRETQRFDPDNKYYGLDHDGYGHVVLEECLKKSGHEPSKEKIYESQNNFNALNIHMGQMTVYRLRLKCTCSQLTNVTSDERCAKILPYNQQRWPAYMGRNGDSYWAPPT